MNYPLVWLVLAAPLAWRGRPVEEVSVLRWFVAAVFLLFMISALTLCLFFSASIRYELEFLPALMLLAVIGILGLERALAGTPVWRRIARWGWCLLLAYAVGFNLLASVEAIAEANYFTGNILVKQGRVNEALEHFQKALALEPGSAAFHGGLGTAYYQKKRMDEAIVQYQKALEIKPDFAEAAEAHNNLGYALLQKERVNEAITHFQKALEIEPDFAEAHNTLGDCLFQIGRVDEAIVQYQKALEIKPDFVEAQNNLGYSLFQIGRVNEAITHFQKALEINPDFAEAQNNLGYSLLQKGRVNEAITHFQKALAIQQSYGAYYNLGNAFRRKGMAAEAMACYQKAIELQPQFIPAQINLAWMLATWPAPSVRNGDKAVALAEQANQFSKGKDPLILRTLAAAYAEAGRFPEAVLTAKQALALAMAQSDTGLTNALQTEIGLYQTNSPCRSPNN
jgi:tetratricopeptide (TPR) repeat protein